MWDRCAGHRSITATSTILPISSGRRPQAATWGRWNRGNVASVLGETDLLGLVSIDNNFLSLVEILRAVYPQQQYGTACLAAGAVRAENGSAGGYAGHSLGGQIEGNAGSGEDTDAGFQYVPSEAAAYRIRSVYGLDYAGGFTGLMETASVAETGSLKLLGDLITIDNPLTAAQGVYPVGEPYGCVRPAVPM